SEGGNGGGGGEIAGFVKIVRGRGIGRVRNPSWESPAAIRCPDAWLFHPLFPLTGGGSAGLFRCSLLASPRTPPLRLRFLTARRAWRARRGQGGLRLSH